jgi:hypothetical protein
MKTRGPTITADELDAWRLVYPTGGAAAVQALFPHRSRNCINVTAHRRGIKVADLPAFKIKNIFAAMQKSKHHKEGRWTTSEDAVLQEFYVELGPRGVMPMLPGRTCGAIITRAGTIGANSPHAPVFQRDHKFKQSDHREVAA